MKLVLFLLVSSTCALVSLSNPASFDPSSKQVIDFQLSPQSRANLLDTFRTFILNIIEDATQFIQDYATKAASIVSSIQNQIGGLSTLAGSTVDKITSDFKTLMQSWQNETQIAYNCTLKYAPLIEEAANKTQQEMQICVQNATVALEGIKATIEPSIGEIVTYVNLLQGLVDDCFKNSTNIFQGIACVVGKGNDIQTNIQQIVKNIKDILTIAAGQGLDLVKNTGKCLNTAVDSYQLEVTKLQLEFKNCILDGFW